VSELTYLVGDVHERLREIPDNSIDLVVTSPPFLALRSYLPADHPDKGKEIGSEATPAAFLDTLLALTAEWGRVLAPHGSICVELGDTYSGNGDPGWDRTINPAHMTNGRKRGGTGDGRSRDTRAGWPLAKSLTGIPTLYPWSLAYGRNLLTGQPSPAGQWRIRNIIVWARPNPPVGALGDKFRPATSYITVACRGPKRYFDLDAVRTEYVHQDRIGKPINNGQDNTYGDDVRSTWSNQQGFMVTDKGGAPPLDWHTDNHPEDGDWLWKLSTQPYRGAHYATFPLELPTRLIMAMCPLRVCTVCGKPSERIVAVDYEAKSQPNGKRVRSSDTLVNPSGAGFEVHEAVKRVETLGWSDCGHNTWRTGRVLDPFAGSGTTLQAAQNVGRHATGIDLDNRNAHLAQDRVGMFLEVQP
jgi:DNA modification methylase